MQALREPDLHVWVGQVVRSVIGLCALWCVTACSSHSGSVAGGGQECAPVCDTDQTPEGVIDPFESLNREIFRFNTGFDAVIFNPTLRLYRSLTVPRVRASVSNFLRNLLELPNALNIFLQNDPDGALQSVERFIVNSTLGVFGLFDIAASLEIERQNETLGQTLAIWGVKPGPYVVIPILGPSRMRDAAGLGTSFWLNPRIAPYYLTGQSSSTISIARGMIIRERFLDQIEELYATQLDPYSVARNFYVRSIEADIRDIRVPADPDFPSATEDEDVYGDLPDFDDF